MERRTQKELIEDEVEKAIDKLDRNIEELEMAYFDEMDLIKGFDDGYEEEPDVDVEEEDENKDTTEEAKDELDRELDISYELAQKSDAMETDGHEMERDRFGNVIGGQFNIPPWLDRINLQGIDYDPAEMSKGMEHELKWHTQNPVEAQQRVIKNLEESPNYYSELLNKVTTEVQHISDTLDEMIGQAGGAVSPMENMDLIKEEPQIPAGYRYSEEFSCLEKIPEGELKKSVKIGERLVIEDVEKDFRKSLGLGQQQLTQYDIQKAVLGESTYGVHVNKGNGKLEKIECADEDEALRKSMEIIEDPNEVGFQK